MRAPGAPSDGAGAGSNTARGRRAKASGTRHHTVEIDEDDMPGAAQARRNWAALIQHVWRVDPLVCPRCHDRLKIVSFITTSQRHLIEKKESPRAPPHDHQAAPRDRGCWRAPLRH